MSGCLSPQPCFEVSCHDSWWSGRPEPSLQSRSAPCCALTAYWCTPASFLASKRALILLLLCWCCLLFPLQGGQPCLREINLPVCLVRLEMEFSVPLAGQTSRAAPSERGWLCAETLALLTGSVCSPPTAPCTGAAGAGTSLPGPAPTY